MSDMTLAMLLTLRDLASGPLGKVQGKLQSFAMEVRSIGASAKAMGTQMLDAMREPIAAFMDAEDAALRLKTTMMGKDGGEPVLFTKMNTLATELGNKLPGTTAEFQRTFAALVREGVPAAQILDGVGEATGNLAVVLGLGFEEAAKFAGQISQIAKVSAKDMPEFMDTIQKLGNLGISTADLGYAFSKSAGAFEKFGIAGKGAATELAPIYAMLMKSTGLSGETLGTNFTSTMSGLYEFEAGNKGKKVAAQLKAMGIELDIFGKDRKFLGAENMQKQLDKLQKAPVKLRDEFIKAAFGAGGVDAQLAEILISKGTKGLAEWKKNVDEQANLKQRIDVILTSLKNIWESAEGSFTTMLAALGKAIAPELKASADAFGVMADKVATLIEKNPGIAKFVGLTALIGGGTLVAGGTALMGVAAAASGVSSAGNLMAKVKLAEKITDIGSGAKNAIGAVKTWNTTTGAMAVANANAAGGAITKMPGLLWNQTKELSKAAAGGVVSLPNKIRDLGKATASTVGGAITKIPGLIKAKAGAMRDGVSASISFVRHTFFTRAGLQGLAATGWSKITGGLRAVAGGIRAMGLAALGNPLLWIAIAIAGAAILIFKYWKPITGFFKGVWAGIKEGLAPLKPAFDGAFKKLAPILNPIMGALKSLWGWIKNLLKPVDDVGGRSQNMGKQFGLAIAGMIKKGLELLTAFAKLPGELMSIGKNMAQGLIDGFMKIPIVGSVVGKVRDMIQAVRGEAKVQSPSRVFMYIGNMMGSGLELGMDAKAAGINKAAIRMAKAATPQMPDLALAGGSRAAGPGAGGGASRNITFAPVIQITAAPGGNIGAQVQQAVTDSYPQFVALMRRYEHDNRRGDPA